MKKCFFIVLMLLISYTSIGNADNNEFNVKPKYSLEAVELAYKVSTLKKKYHLQYKDGADLLETCDKIVEHCKKEVRFDKYDVSSIVIRESKFNHKAYNKREHVKGLMQITKPRIYWKKELSWYTDPLDKDQNIRAGLVVLNTFYKEHKTKKKAIKHYNGSGWRSDEYAEFVLALKHEIKSVKI